MQLERVREVKTAARAALQERFFDDESSRSVTLGIGLKDDEEEEGPGDYVLTARIRTPQRRPDLEQRIRGLLRGFVGDELDLQYTGPVFALRPIERVIAQPPKLMIGASVSHYLTLGGTLGFFATSRDHGTPGLVSANHVIGNLNNAKVGDPIVSPAGGNPATNKVAEFVRLTRLCAGTPLHVDAAFAKLSKGVSVDRSSLPNGEKLTSTIAYPHETRHVIKLGMKSQLTFGRVRSFDLDDFETLGYYGLGTVRFDDQIEVESSDPDPQKHFAIDGDSGSLVFNRKFHSVGLLFAATLAGGHFKNGLTYVNPMRFVLDELNVNLAV